ncbi:zinc finger C2HC domain-containing protein 1C [Latimeria chalumnae]|uniref:zinc finger C2HC domain-containing protein 1C n=1 Tax=Latimeria chalumnae TaxID=7897 RepID=UPI0003C0FC55|nr:PREDICTED: zinc finger C2HC domain-containing protein 1C [Latimeria chalumnae]|eukprot:XP_005986617.1 PREDICTED: zinc finger C2HC domain-containing protein 1C [Latimeria chalumnae]
MAHLQMAPYSHINPLPFYDKMNTAKLPDVGHNRQTPQILKPQSRLELMKIELQQKLLREKEDKLITLFNQQQQLALSKVRTNHKPTDYSTSSAQRPSGMNVFSSGGTRRLDGTYQARQFSGHSTTLPDKRSAGIDRAHPLRPMCHRKAASLNNIFNPEEIKNLRVGEPTKNTLLRPSPPAGVSRASNSKSRRRSSGFKNIEGLAPSPVHQMQRSVSNHSALEKAWLQEQPKKIQMIEESLEEEIRRKEALIMEKLKRTEEELRRIQKEKERVEEEERKEKERLEKRKTEMEKEARLRSKMVESNQERILRENVNISEHLDCDPMIRNRNRRDTQSQKSRVHNTDFLARTSYLSHPDEDYQQFNAEKLKKERLLSSNNKIKDRESFFSSEDNQNMEEALSYKTNTPNYSPFMEEYNHSSPVTPQTNEDELMNAPLELHENREFHEASFEAAEEDGLVDQIDFSSQLTPCSFCGRKFAVDRLSKHAKICKKSQNSKRKVFDSSKARAKGTDLEQYHNRKSKVTSQPKKNTWRQKHESFIRTIRQAREITQQISRGVKPSDLPTLPPEENPDYVPCSHCGRRFAPKVAERHIPKCENIKSRPPAPPQRRR